MAFTNSTPNYNLPQWISSDKPAFETDMNNAYLTIDTALKNNESGVTSADAKADSATSIANQARTSAQSAMTAANNAQTSADNAKKAADNAQTSATQANTAATGAKEAADRAQSTANSAQTTADSKANVSDTFQSINISTLGTTVNLTFIVTGTSLYRFTADASTPANPVFNVNGRVIPAFDVAGNVIGEGFYTRGATVLCTVSNNNLFILSGGGSGGGGEIPEFNKVINTTITTPPASLSSVDTYQFTIDYYPVMQQIFFTLGFVTRAQIPVNSTLASIESIPELTNATANINISKVIFESTISDGKTIGPIDLVKEGLIFKNNVFLVANAIVAVHVGGSCKTWFPA